MFGVGVSELSAKEEDLSRVVNPHNNNDDRPGGPVGGAET
jgi:hypothetical protein